MAQVVQAYEATMVYEQPRPESWDMSHSQGFIEQHARFKRHGDALQSETIVDVVQTDTADAGYGSKEDDANAQHI